MIQAQLSQRLAACISHSLFLVLLQVSVMACSEFHCMHQSHLPGVLLCLQVPAQQKATAAKCAVLAGTHPAGATLGQRHSRPA